MDGTFDQLCPFKRLVGSQVVYSFDLKSATDRWPLSIQEELLSDLFNCSLVTVAYRLTTVKVPFLPSSPSPLSNKNHKVDTPFNGTRFMCSELTKWKTQLLVMISIPDF